MILQSPCAGLNRLADKVLQYGDKMSVADMAKMMQSWVPSTPRFTARPLHPMSPFPSIELCATNASLSALILVVGHLNLFLTAISTLSALRR